VSSDRENRDFAGKLNDPGKNWDMAGNFAKRRKNWDFSFNYIIFEKEKLQSPFLYFFFQGKKHFFIFLFFNYLQNIIHKLYFVAGRVQIYFFLKLYLSLNLQVKFREFLEKEIGNTGNQPEIWKWEIARHPVIVKRRRFSSQPIVIHMV